MSRSGLRRKASDDTDLSDLSSSQLAPKIPKKTHSQGEKRSIIERNNSNETQCASIARLERELHNLKKDKMAIVDSMETKLALANKRFSRRTEVVRIT